MWGDLRKWPICRPHPSQTGLILCLWWGAKGANWHSPSRKGQAGHEGQSCQLGQRSPDLLPYNCSTTCETAGLLTILAMALSPEGGFRQSHPVGTTKKHISSLNTGREIPERWEEALRGELSHHAGKGSGADKRTLVMTFMKESRWWEWAQEGPTVFKHQDSSGGQAKTGTLSINSWIRIPSLNAFFHFN